MSDRINKKSCRKEYFPLFVNVTDRKVTVIGGGHIATRRIKTLLRFQCDIIVISPSLSSELKKRVEWKAREYHKGDCIGSIFVVTATHNREVNHAVALECEELNIPVSVADSKEESTFYFPGVAIEDPVVVGITASGEDHTLAKTVTKKIRTLLATHKSINR